MMNFGEIITQRKGPPINAIIKALDFYETKFKTYNTVFGCPSCANTCPFLNFVLVPNDMNL